MLTVLECHIKSIGLEDVTFGKSHLEMVPDSPELGLIL